MRRFRLVVAQHRTRRMSFKACAHINALEIKNDQFCHITAALQARGRFCSRMRSGTTFAVAFSSFALPIVTTFIFRTAKLSKPSGRSPEVGSLPDDTSSRGVGDDALHGGGPETFPNFSSR